MHTEEYLKNPGYVRGLVDQDWQELAAEQSFNELIMNDFRKGLQEAIGGCPGSVCWIASHGQIVKILTTWKINNIKSILQSAKI